MNPSSTSPPQITVLIPAHNESENIQACLRAIQAQDYPMERVEVVLVNDRCTDDTVERAREVNGELRVINIEQPPDNMTARQAALDRGIREARGELILITDADGRVPREWIRELSGHISYRDGAVTAPVIFAGQNPIFARFQTVESLIMFSLYRLFYRHGFKAGLFLANCAIRREAYLETGGFAATGFSLVDGVDLGQSLSQGGWSLRYLLEPAVQNHDVKSFAELIQRERRELRGASRAIIAIWMLLIVSNLILILGALLATGWLGITGWVLVIAARYGLGLGLIGMAISQYRTYRSRRWAVLFEPILTLIGSIAFIYNLVSPTWKWGGIVYHRHGPALDAKPSQSS